MHEFTTHFIACPVYFIDYNRYNLFIEEKTEQGGFPSQLL